MFIKLGHGNNIKKISVLQDLGSKQAFYLGLLMVIVGEVKADSAILFALCTWNEVEYSVLLSI